MIDLPAPLTGVPRTHHMCERNWIVLLVGLQVVFMKQVFSWPNYGARSLVIYFAALLD